jgi:hypothetical protein
VRCRCGDPIVMGPRRWTHVGRGELCYPAPSEHRTGRGDAPWCRPAPPGRLMDRAAPVLAAAAAPN